MKLIFNTTACSVCVLIFASICIAAAHLVYEHCFPAAMTVRILNNTDEVLTNVRVSCNNTEVKTSLIAPKSWGRSDIATHSSAIGCSVLADFPDRKNVLAVAGYFFTGTVIVSINSPIDIIVEDGVY